MAFPSKKPDFLDGVVDEMGPEDKGDYGASMSEDDGMDDESDPEEAEQDRVMAARSIAKALGVPDADAPKLAQALKAFISNC